MHPSGTQPINYRCLILLTGASPSPWRRNDEWAAASSRSRFVPVSLPMKDDNGDTVTTARGGGLRWLPGGRSPLVSFLLFLSLPHGISLFPRWMEWSAARGGRSDRRRPLLPRKWLPRQRCGVPRRPWGRRRPRDSLEDARRRSPSGLEVTRRHSPWHARWCAAALVTACRGLCGVLWQRRDPAVGVEWCDGWWRKARSMGDLRWSRRWLEEACQTPLLLLPHCQRDPCVINAKVSLIFRFLHNLVWATLVVLNSFSWDLDNVKIIILRFMSRHPDCKLLLCPYLGLLLMDK
jgi:hypothetical protein